MRIMQPTMIATNNTSTIALADAGGYCIAWISVDSMDTIEALWPAAHLLHDEIVTHHLGENQDRPQCDACLPRQWDDDIDHGTPLAGAGVAGGFQQGGIDL